MGDCPTAICDNSIAAIDKNGYEYFNKKYFMLLNYRDLTHPKQM